MANPTTISKAAAKTRGSLFSDLVRLCSLDWGDTFCDVWLDIAAGSQIISATIAVPRVIAKPEPEACGCEVISRSAIRILNARDWDGNLSEWRDGAGKLWSNYGPTIVSHRSKRACGSHPCRVVSISYEQMGCCHGRGFGCNQIDETRGACPGIRRLQIRLQSKKDQWAYPSQLTEKYGAPGGIRTPDPLLRRQTLSPD